MAIVRTFFGDIEIDDGPPPGPILDPNILLASHFDLPEGEVDGYFETQDIVGNVYRDPGTSIYTTEFVSVAQKPGFGALTGIFVNDSIFPLDPKFSPSASSDLYIGGYLHIPDYTDIGNSHCLFGLSSLQSGGLKDDLAAQWIGFSIRNSMGVPTLFFSVREGQTGADIELPYTLAAIGNGWTYFSIVFTPTEFIVLLDDLIIETRLRADFPWLNTTSSWFCFRSDNYATGYLDDLIITKTIPPYGNGTPPTAPFNPYIEA